MTLSKLFITVWLVLALFTNNEYILKSAYNMLKNWETGVKDIEEDSSRTVELSMCNAAFWLSVRVISLIKNSMIDLNS